MNRGVALVILVVAVILSLGLGYKLGTTANAPTGAETNDARYEQAREKLSKISETDMMEYLALKDLKARYEKADEILGKILMLMLYDFGIRAGEGQLKMLKDKALLATSETIETPVPELESPQERLLPPPGSITAARVEAPPTISKLSAQTSEVNSEDEAKDLLKKLEIPNIFDELKNSRPLTETQLEILNGTFEGEAIFEDPKTKPWQVSIRFNGHMVDGKYQGKHVIRMTKEGKQFSRSSGGIKEDNYMQVAADPNAIIIDAYGGDGYFQLYYFSRLNQFYGSVYVKKSLGKFERTGFVRLTKR